MLLVVLSTAACMPLFAHAEDTSTVVEDTVHIERAVVEDVSNGRETTVPGTDTPTQVQTVTARVLEGPDAGQTPTFENDYTQLAPGDRFFIRHQTNALDGIEYWSVSDPDRIGTLSVLAAVFLVLLLLFGGIQGVRGLASLFGSIILIMYVLLPGILAGYSPILVSIGVSSLIIIVGSYITHGFNRSTHAAVIGMLAAVALTGVGAYYIVSTGHFSGYSSEESVDLNFNTQGTINLVGLLFGGIMIGLLGVLYDIAISQAIAVEELFRAGIHMTRFEVYRRAIRIGREHIGALVNTLAIAYVGAALPLLLLLKETYTPDEGILPIINSELFATEIVRILVGSIGLILAVPITTAIATYLLQNAKDIPRRAGEGHAHHH